jgi:hypothetical protein
VGDLPPAHAAREPRRALGHTGGVPARPRAVVVAINAVTNKVVTILGGMASLGELLPADSTLAAARLIGFAAVLVGTAMLARFGAVPATREAPPTTQAA